MPHSGWTAGLPRDKSVGIRNPDSHQCGMGGPDLSDHCHFSQLLGLLLRVPVRKGFVSYFCLGCLPLWKYRHLHSFFMQVPLLKRKFPSKVPPFPVSYRDLYLFIFLTTTLKSCQISHVNSQMYESNLFFFFFPWIGRMYKNWWKSI